MPGLKLRSNRRSEVSLEVCHDAIRDPIQRRELLVDDPPSLVVSTIAALAWSFDTMDQRIFNPWRADRR